MNYRIQCIQCGKDANMKCSVCKLARYCSRECQRENWSIHKNICSSSTADDSIIHKGIINKIKTLNFKGSKRFIMSYTFALRCNGMLHVTFTTNECKLFLSGKLDINNYIEHSSKMNISVAPNTTLWIIVGDVHLFTNISTKLINNHICNRYK